MGFFFKAELIMNVNNDDFKPRKSLWNNEVRKKKSANNNNKI